MPEPSLVSPGLDDVAATVATTAETFVYAYPVLRALEVLHEEVVSGGRPFNVLLPEPEDASGAGRSWADPAVLRCSAWLHLGAGPVVVGHPALPPRRFVSLQLVDLMAHPVAELGTATTGGDAHRWVVAGPRWGGPLPEGLPVLRAQSEIVHLTALTTLAGADDLDEAWSLTQRYEVRPAAHVAGATPETPMPAPAWDDARARGADFGDYLEAVLTVSSPSHPDERALLQRWRGLGSAGHDASHRTLLTRGAALGAARLHDALARDPDVELADPAGWSSDALLARAARAATDPFTSAQGSVMTLRLPPIGEDPPRGHRRRRLTFAADGMPPARTWSISLCHAPSGDPVRSPGHQDWISPLTPGLVLGPDGSLVVRIQHDEPTDPADRANWLRAPAGAYCVVVRLYGPAPAAQHGEWRPPTLRTVE